MLPAWITRLKAPRGQLHSGDLHIIKTFCNSGVSSQLQVWRQQHCEVRKAVQTETHTKGLPATCLLSPFLTNSNCEMEKLHESDILCSWKTQEEVAHLLDNWHRF